MLWVRFVIAFHLLYQDLKRDLGREGITIPQLDVIVCLGRNYGLTLKELSQRLVVTGGNITGLIDRLEKDGLLYRERDKRDRRVWRARLTPLGQEISDRLFPIYKQRLEETFGNLNDDEQKSFNQILKKLVGFIENKRSRNILHDGKRDPEKSSRKIS